MDPHSATIQKLSDDVSYLRGRFDTAWPLMQKSADDINQMLRIHSEEITELQKGQENMRGKATVVGSVAGLSVAAIFTWISKHF